MEKLLEGLVKGVYSGDYISISGKVQKNSDKIPEEKKISLNLIHAPRIANENSVEEEAYAWESRNFLRTLILGKVIKYTEDTKNGERVLGQIFHENKNINVELVKNGLAKVTSVKQGDSATKTDYYAKLIEAETEAKKNKVGVWNDNQQVLAKHKRKVFI